MCWTAISVSSFMDRSYMRSNTYTFIIKEKKSLEKVFFSKEQWFFSSGIGLICKSTPLHISVGNMYPEFKESLYIHMHSNLIKEINGEISSWSGLLTEYSWLTHYILKGSKAKIDKEMFKNMSIFHISIPEYILCSSLFQIISDNSTRMPLDYCLPLLGTTGGNCLAIVYPLWVLFAGSWCQLCGCSQSFDTCVSTLTFVTSHYGKLMGMSIMNFIFIARNFRCSRPIVHVLQ